MRILFAVHGYKPAYRMGGPIHSVSALAEGLVKLGHEVIVFTTNSNLDEDLNVPTDRPTDVNGVEVWYFQHVEPVKRFLPWVSYVSQSIGFLYAPRMAKALDRLMPTVDVVHTHLPFVYPSLAAIRSAKKHGKPYLYHQRGVFHPERLKFRSLKKQAYIKLIEKPAMGGAATLVALTEAEAATFRAMGVSAPIVVIPNGVDADSYRTTPLGSLSRLGLPNEAPVVLFLGRIHPLKGADVLLDAFLTIAEEHPAARLVLAGPDEIGQEKAFRDDPRLRSVGGKIVFAGMVTGEEKLDLLARASVFCLPSAGEGFSIAILEALASETPVVISPGCNFPEVADYQAGWITEANPAALASTLGGILGDESLLRRTGARGRALVQEHYTWGAITAKMASVYTQVTRKSVLESPK